MQRILLASLALVLGLSAAPAQADNDSLHRDYAAFQAANPGSRRALGQAEVAHLFRLTKDHPVASLSDENIAKYDPTGEIGYCYGRSMAAHLAARRMGLTELSVRKLFILGDLRSGVDPEWRFHVTTLVRSVNAGGLEEWTAVDPIFAAPMTARTWLGAVRAIWDREGKSRAYLTSADAVLPDVRRFPAPEAETGDSIIELSFTPEGAEGFTRSPGYGERAYRLGAIAEEIHFLRASTEGAIDAFDFTRMVVGGPWEYDYHGYFVDLLADLLGRPASDFVPPAATETETETETEPVTETASVTETVIAPLGLRSVPGSR
ncbi:MAG: hypothetical protein IT285_05430 [Bdellovibrionales bacterium]|nr:hypothetical protein [Bdellovibrionales bacterium]